MIASVLGLNGGNLRAEHRFEAGSILHLRVFGLEGGIEISVVFDCDVWFRFRLLPLDRLLNDVRFRFRCTGHHFLLLSLDTAHRCGNSLFGWRFHRDTRNMEDLLLGALSLLYWLSQGLRLFPLFEQSSLLLQESLGFLPSGFELLAPEVG